MKRFISIFILIAVLSMSFSTGTLAISEIKEKRVGSYKYIVRTVTTTVKKRPITATQVQHRKGYQTTITTNVSYSSSVGATDSLSTGVSFYLEMATEIGVTQSEDFGVDAGVSYTIPASEPSARYRISMFFPGSKVYYETWTLEPCRIDFRQITYAPDDGASYYDLDEYA